VNLLLKVPISSRFSFSHQGPVSPKPQKLFGHVKPLQNLEPCDYRAVLFTYSKDEGRFTSYKKFQAYTDDLKMALRARKLSRAFKKRAPDPTFHAMNLGEKIFRFG